MFPYGIVCCNDHVSSWVVNFIGIQGERVNGSLEVEDYKQPLVWIDLEMTGMFPLKVALNYFTCQI